MGYIADFIDPHNTAAGPQKRYFKIQQHIIDGDDAHTRVAVYTNQTAADNGDSPLATFNPFNRGMSFEGAIKIDYKSADNEKTQIYKRIMELDAYKDATPVLDVAGVNEEPLEGGLK
jgi:Neuraminidase (sialidase)